MTHFGPQFTQDSTMGDGKYWWNDPAGFRLDISDAVDKNQVPGICANSAGLDAETNIAPDETPEVSMTTLNREWMDRAIKAEKRIDEIERDQHLVRGRLITRYTVEMPLRDYDELEATGDYMTRYNRLLYWTTVVLAAALGVSSGGNIFAWLL